MLDRLSKLEEEEAQARGSTAIDEFVHEQRTIGAQLANEHTAAERQQREAWIAKCATIVPRQRHYFVVNEIRKHYDELCYHWDHSRLNFPAAIDNLVKEYSQHYRAVHPKEGTAAATTEPHETEIREWIAADLARLARESCAEFHSIRSGAASRGHDLPAWHIEFIEFPEDAA